MARTGQSVIVVGAGIAGLTAAWHLARGGCAVTVLEAGDEIGGRVGQRQAGPIRYSAGARLLYPFSRDFNRMLKEIGLADSLEPLHHLSARCVGPTGDWTLELMPGPRSFMTPHLGLGDRARLLAYGARALWQRRRADPDDAASLPAADAETLSAHVSRLIGPKVLAQMIAPVFRGTRGWQADTVSAAFLATTMPHLIGGRAVHVPRGGMAMLPKALAAGLDIRCGADVTGVEPAGSGGVRVTLRDGAVLAADHGVIAVQGSRAASLVRSLGLEDHAFLAGVRYTPYGALHLALSGDLPHDLCFFADGAGGPISTFETLPTAAATGAPCQVLGQLSPEMAGQVAVQGWTDAHRTAVLNRLEALLPGCRARIVAGHFQWIPDMLPDFRPGYATAMADFRDRQAASPRPIRFCGDYLAQALVTGAAASGTRVAREILALRHPHR